MKQTMGKMGRFYIRVSWKPRKGIVGLIIISSVFFALNGCVRSIPLAVNNETSAIAIKIDQRYTFIETSFFLPSVKSYMMGIKNIYVIKLKDKSDSLKQDRMLASNFSLKPLFSGHDTFLLNIEPGYYAAVGAMEDGIYIYFPEEVIKESITEVKPNTMAYMGQFELQTISNRSKYIPDELQQYYYSNLLFYGHRDIQGKMFITNMPLPQFHAPKVKTILKSAELEKQFLSGILNTFSNTEWMQKIQNRLNELMEK